MPKRYELILAVVSRPCVIPDAVTHVTSENEEVRAKFSTQGARDWEQILLMRAKELASGKCHTYTQHTFSYNNRLRGPGAPLDPVLEAKF